MSLDQHQAAFLKREKERLAAKDKSHPIALVADAPVEVAKEPVEKPAPAVAPNLMSYPEMWFLLKDTLIRTHNDVVEKYLKPQSTGEKANAARDRISIFKGIVATMDEIYKHYADEDAKLRAAKQEGEKPAHATEPQQPDPQQPDPRD
ncbi:MAG: hypothetical protein Q8N15_04105 [Bacillota bacterium]|nr:hypothetical protein [Bacillota bacterium]